MSTWHLDIDVETSHDLGKVLEAIAVLAHEHPGALTLCDSDGVVILDYPAVVAT